MVKTELSAYTAYTTMSAVQDRLLNLIFLSLTAYTANRRVERGADGRGKGLLFGHLVQAMDIAREWSYHWFITFFMCSVAGSGGFHSEMVINAELSCFIVSLNKQLNSSRYTFGWIIYGNHLMLLWTIEASISEIFATNTTHFVCLFGIFMHFMSMRYHHLLLYLAETSLQTWYSFVHNRFILCTHIHTDTYICIYMHACTHTRTHIHIRRYAETNINQTGLRLSRIDTYLPCIVRYRHVTFCEYESLEVKEKPWHQITASKSTADGHIIGNIRYPKIITISKLCEVNSIISQLC